VTGRPAVFNNHDKSKVFEIIIDVEDINIKDIKKIDQMINTYYKIGYNIVTEDLKYLLSKGEK